MPPEIVNLDMAPDWSLTRQAILGDMGEPLLRFMREVFFGRVASSIDQKIVSTALALGWITKGNNDYWKLTSHGAKVADSAREYCNWLDDKRGLPAKITEKEISGKAVLDIGCGFGRHVFSASRCALLAVGLEAEQAYLQMSSILRFREGITSAFFVCGNGEKVPFADGVFDIIVCTRSLQYMDASIVVPEIARVLRVGGKLYLTVPTFQQFILDMICRPQQPLKIRDKLGLAKKMINSIILSCTGKQLFRRKTKSTTGTYALLTTRRLIRIMECAGLKLASRSAPEGLFVVERIR
ncbi:MAG: class I SAM-dependent methyltransferase [Gallionella sp.]